MTYQARRGFLGPATGPAALEPERSPSKPPAGNAAVAAGRKLAPSERLLGHNVTIRLRSGEVLEGRYVNGSRYEMQLVVGERRVIVFKHAVDWIEPRE